MPRGPRKGSGGRQRSLIRVNRLAPCPHENARYRAGSMTTNEHFDEALVLVPGLRPRRWCTESSPLSGVVS
jgi:hypothetical protein